MSLSRIRKGIDTPADRMKYWVCPKCKTKYDLPSGARIMSIVPKWDYCPKCMVYRKNDTKTYIR